MCGDNQQGERCGAARLKGCDRCFWHANDPGTVRRRKEARNEGRAVLRRLVVERDQLSDLTITTPADLWALQRWLGESVMTGELDPRAAETASRVGERMLAAFETTVDGLRLGSIDPRTFPPELVGKLRARRVVPFFGSSKQATRDEKRLADLVELRLAHIKADGWGTLPASPKIEDGGQQEPVTSSPQDSDKALTDLLDRDLAEALAREDRLVELLLDPNDVRCFDEKARTAGFDEIHVAGMFEGGFAARFRLELVGRCVVPRLKGIIEGLLTRAEEGEVSAIRALADLLEGCGIDTAHLHQAAEKLGRLSEGIKNGKRGYSTGREAVRDRDAALSDQELREIGLPTAGDEIGVTGHD